MIKTHTPLSVGEALISEAVALAWTVARGGTEHVEQLAQTAVALANACAAPGWRSRRIPAATGDPTVDLIGRLEHRGVAAATAAQARAVGSHELGRIHPPFPGTQARAPGLRSGRVGMLPDPLPLHDDISVLMYREITPGAGSLLHAIARGDQEGLDWVIVNLKRRVLYGLDPIDRC